jgi:hypothetical protein
MFAQSARTGEPLWRSIEDIPGYWHRYCIKRVIGGIETGRAVSQVGIRLHPRLLLVVSEEAVKEMETDGSHCKKGI